MRESKAQDWIECGAIGIQFGFINIIVAIKAIGIEELTLL